jgi:Ca-activated chloride channel family protein
MVRLRLALALLGLIALACGRDTKTQEPSNTREKLLRLEATLDGSYVRAEASEPIVARIRIAPEPRPERKRPAVNLALVVDTSGSMQGKAIEDAKKASMTLVDSLKDGDRLAVVSFDSSSHVLVQSAELDDDSRKEMRQKLEAMRAVGTTDMESGLREGIAQVTAHTNPQGINRIVLLGDGIPNEEGSIRGLVQGARGSGISITALGLGADYNEALMGEIAQISGGKFHYVDDSKKVATFFQEEVLRLDGVYARNAELEFVPGPGISVERVVGQATTADGKKFRLPLGDLSRGEKREIFLRLRVSDQKAGANVELCDAVLRYDSPGGQRTEERVFLGAKASTDEKQLKLGKNSEIELGSAFAEAAATTLQAIQLARAGQRPQAIELLKKTADEIEKVAKLYANKKLADEVEALRGLASDLPQPTADVAPAPAAGAGMAPPKRPVASPESAERLRRQHDSALQRLQ